MTMTLVEYSVQNRIGTITLNRPEKRNALNPQIISELKDAFQQASTDQEVKVIVLRSKGEVFLPGPILNTSSSCKNFLLKKTWPTQNI